MKETEILSIVLAFLQDIGLVVVATELNDESFPPGLRIDRGKILYDEARLTYPGDLLHLGAHIAVVPAEVRPTLTTDLPDREGVEMAVLAWAYAASQYLGLDPETVFHDGPGSYRGESETIIENFSRGQFLGVPILAWKGMTIDPQQAEPRGELPFPNMLQWVCTQSDPVDEQPAGQALSPRSANPPKLPLAAYTGSLMDVRHRFTALAVSLLGEVGDPIDFRDAAYDLYTLFNEIGGKPQDVIGAEAFTWQQETLLPTGKAVNPHTAATCLLDYARTRAFARGVHDAIEAAKIQFPGERIEVLYAGTGPYAPLALLQTPFFSPDEVCFTLIDVHESALSCQAQIISVLGLEDYVEETIQADAARWTPPAEKQYHAVVAEVMQRALITEPQVAVTFALLKHMYPGGLLVPERIELTLCLLDLGAEQTQVDACATRFTEYFRLSGDSIDDLKNIPPDADSARGRQRVIIGSRFVLTDAVAEAHELTDEGHIRLPPVRVPDSFPTGYVLRILTEIATSGDIILGDYDSGLTLPEPVFDQPPLTPGGLYEIWYETRGIPGLRMRPAD